MANRVFRDDAIALTIDTKKDVSMFPDLRVKYEDPDGDKGYWTATLHPSIDTKIQASVVFSKHGIWKIQAFVANGPTKYHGQAVDIKVFEPLAPTTTLVPTTPAP